MAALKKDDFIAFQRGTSFLLFFKFLFIFPLSFSFSLCPFLLIFPLSFPFPSFLSFSFSLFPSPLPSLFPFHFPSFPPSFPSFLPSFPPLIDFFSCDFFLISLCPIFLDTAAFLRMMIIFVNYPCYQNYHKIYPENHRFYHYRLPDESKEGRDILNEMPTEAERQSVVEVLPKGLGRCVCVLICLCVCI